MFRRAVIPVVVLAATLCPIPVIGEAAEPIQNLALQPGDMPAAARSQSPAPMTDAEELGALAPYGVREGALRISPHFPTDRSDLEHLVHSLHEFA